MTLNKVLVAISMALLVAATVVAQTPVEPAPVPGQRGGATAGDVGLVLPILVLGQRGAGGRGAGPVPGTATADGRTIRAAGAPTAWWTDTRLVAQLGLSEDQMRSIERTFDAHRQNLVSNTEALQREETQLSRMLEAETVDRAGVSTQINRVIQARGEVERTNSSMTLEMREHLTRAQWMQLQSSQSLVAVRVVAPGTSPQVATPFGVTGGVVGPGTRGGGLGGGTRGGPAAPPLPGAPMRVGAAVAQQSLISSVAPEYPALARAARAQATVRLDATISKEGTVSDLKVVSGHPLLNDAALAAVRQWRYRPMLLNGEPVVIVTTIEVPFNLQ